MLFDQNDQHHVFFSVKFDVKQKIRSCSRKIIVRVSKSHGKSKASGLPYKILPGESKSGFRFFFPMTLKNAVK